MGAQRIMSAWPTSSSRRHGEHEPGADDGFQDVAQSCLVDELPDAYLAMGLNRGKCGGEISSLARRSGWLRLRKPSEAIAAIEAGRFKEESVSVSGREVTLDQNSKRKVTEFVLETDEGPRRDTSLENSRRCAGVHPRVR